jgi:hypothetical protein
MNREAPKAWAGIPWATEQPVIIQNASGENIAVGRGAIIRPDSGTFWTESPQPKAPEQAAFVIVGTAAPVALKRFYWPGGDRINWVFEV